MVTTVGVVGGAVLTLVAVVLHLSEGSEWRPREDISQEVVERRAESVPETDFPEPSNRSIGGALVARRLLCEFALARGLGAADGRDRAAATDGAVRRLGEVRLGDRLRPPLDDLLGDVLARLPLGALREVQHDRNQRQYRPADDTHCRDHTRAWYRPLNSVVIPPVSAGDRRRVVGSEPFAGGPPE